MRWMSLLTIATLVSSCVGHDVAETSRKELAAGTALALGGSALLAGAGTMIGIGARDLPTIKLCGTLDGTRSSSPCPDPPNSDRQIGLIYGGIGVAVVGLAMIAISIPILGQARSDRRRARPGSAR